MPATVSHALSATTPDNPSYEIRPSHWNSAHAITLNAVGSEISGAFSNANGVSFGLSAGALTASHNGLTSQSNQAFSAAGGSSTFQTLSFSNANGITFSNSNGAVVASYTVPTVPGATVFSNSNNVSFGLNGSTITASATVAQTNQTIGVYASSNTTGQSSSSTLDARTLSIRGAGIASVGLSGGELIVSVPSAGGSVNFSAGTTSNNLNAVTFSNANGVSFGLNASTITGSVAAQTNQSIGLYASSQTTGQSSSSTVDARSVTVVGRGIISVGMSAGSMLISASAAGAADGYNLIAAGTQTANTTGTIVFSNSNGVTFGMSNSSVVTASHNGLTSQSNQAVSGSNGSFTFQTFTLGNLNGASFYTSNGSVVMSYTTPDVGTVSAGTSIATLGQILLADSNGISFGASNNTITASYNPFGGGISGGNTSGNTGTVASRLFLAGGNNVTLSGSTNGGSITVTVSAGAAGAAVTASAANGSFTIGNLSFSNANGVSFGTSAGSAITASHNGLTSQSNQAASGSNGSFTFQTLSFSNGNGVSFGTSAGSAITASYTVPGTLSVFGQSNTTLSSSGTIPFNSLQFQGAGAISVGVSNGSVVISGAAGAQSNQTIGLYASSNTTGQSSSTTVDARTLSVRGAGIASVGYSAGELIVSVPSAGGSVNFSAGTTSNNLNAITFSNANGVSFGLNASTITGSVAAQTNQTVGLYAVGNTTQNSSTTLDARTISFNGLGALTAGFSNGTVQLSAPATSSLSATGQVSISTNGSTISIGVPSALTQDGFNPYPDLVYVMTQVGQGTLQMDPQGFPNCQFDRILYPIHNTNSSNSSGSHTISINIGLYTKNGSTLSRYTSWQGTTALTHSGTQGSYSFFSGLRHFSFAAAGTITEGRYWMAVNSVTTSGGANGSYSNLVVSAINSNFSGLFGVSHATTAQFTLGQGIYTATTNGMPASIAFSELRGSDSQGQRPPVFGFAMGTA